jgi:hypothetical protein
MEHAEWRAYHGHFIVERKAGLFGRRRYDVWRAGEAVASFRDSIKAELYIDALTGK